MLQATRSDPERSKARIGPEGVVDADILPARKVRVDNEFREICRRRTQHFNYGLMACSLKKKRAEELVACV